MVVRLEQFIGEKGETKMKDKEKQIEDVETIIKSNLAEGSFANTFARKVAIQIVEHYQPKLPEDSVVLSREEYKNLKHYENEMYRLQGVVDTLTNEGWDILDEKEEKIRKAERKETAEKIIDLIKTFCPDKKFVEVITRIIAERFGVEIKE